jgi:hypothetical protein
VSSQERKYPRIELKWWKTNSKDMEWNLTKIVEQVQELAATAYILKRRHYLFSQNKKGLSCMNVATCKVSFKLSYYNRNLNHWSRWRLVESCSATCENSRSTIWRASYCSVTDPSLYRKFDIAVNWYIFVVLERVSTLLMWTTRYH